MTAVQTFISSGKANMDTVRINNVAGTVSLLIWLATGVGAVLFAGFSVAFVIALVIIGSLAGCYVMFGLKLANQWEKAVVLRFGKILRSQGTWNVLDHPDRGRNHAVG
jgi:hypothetical protein